MVWPAELPRPAERTADPGQHDTGGHRCGCHPAPAASPASAAGFCDHGCRPAAQLPGLESRCHSWPFHMRELLAGLVRGLELRRSPDAQADRIRENAKAELPKRANNDNLFY